MKPHNIIEMLVRIVKYYPNQPALVWEENGKERFYSYQQLWHRIQDVAYGLERLGIRAGSKVAIYAKSNPRAIVCDLAIMTLGAISVPIDPSLSKEQIHKMIYHANTSSILIESPSMLEEIQYLLPHMKHIALLTGRSLGNIGAVTFDTMVQLGQTVAVESYDLPYAFIQRQDLATIVYSFVNNQIRALSYSHGNILHLIQSLSYLLPISSEDRFLSHLPYAQLIERFVGHFYPLLTGACIVHPQPKKGLCHNIQTVMPTVFLHTPELLKQFEEELRQNLTPTTMLERMVASWKKKIDSNAPKTWINQAKKLLIERLYQDRWEQSFGGNLRYLISIKPLSTSLPIINTQFGIPIFQLIGTDDCPVIAIGKSDKDETIFIPLPSTDVRVSTEGELLVKSQSIRIEESVIDPHSNESSMKNGWLATGIQVTLTEQCHIRKWA